MELTSINIFLRLLAASQVFLFLLLIANSKNPIRVRVVATLLMIGVLSYLVAPIIESMLPAGNHAYLWIPASLSAGLLLILAWFIFEEDCRFPLWMVVLSATSMLSSLWFHTHGVALNGAPIWVQWYDLLVVVVVIGVVWYGRDADLIEMRSKVRTVFVFELAILMAVVLALNIYTGFSGEGFLALIEVSLLFIFSLICNYYFIKFNPEFLLMPERAPIKEDSEDPVIAVLLDKMRSERLYADHDLRVATLAERMKIPEYKLRSKINQQLGYRNFNQFVNRYRIEEASQKLLENPRTPVLTIALDVGFRSISSFNTAFQTQFGVSPTKYRAEAL